MATVVVGSRKPRVVNPAARRLIVGVDDHLIECPRCGVVGSVDADQYAGRVSIDCPECDYHETHDLRGG